MSDLSLPPLSLVSTPEETTLPRARPKSRSERFAWPTPALPCYPAPVCQIAPEPCEVEGLNGTVMTGRLTLFSPEDGVLQLQLPPSRTTMPLRLDQFRRLRLTQPLAPLPQHSQDTLPPALCERPAVPYTVQMKAGAPLSGLTIRHQETDYGLFLFEPVDVAGAVRRVFVPRTAYDSAEIGHRIGELLVSQQAATAAEVDAALGEQSELRNRKIGDILMSRQIISREELVNAIEQQNRMPMVRIGEALMALGMITPAQLDEALAQQRNDRGTPLGELLVRRGSVSRGTRPAIRRRRSRRAPACSTSR